MQPHIVSLLETLVKLDEGGYGHVFSVSTISEQSDTLWHCHLCDAKGADEISLTFHIKSKEHGDLMALPSHPLKKFTNIQTELRDIKVQLEQPVPPGTEEIADIKPTVTRLQSILDHYKETPLIGVEYIVEILRPGIGQEAYCCCMLCDKKCHLRTVQGHLTGFLHRLKYINKHFPTFFKTMHERVPGKRATKKQMADSIVRVVTRIETKFGRLCPLYVETEENFEERKELILRKMSEDNHLKETPSETFIEVLDESDENDVKPVSAGLPKFVDANAYVQPAAVEQNPEVLARHLSQLETLLNSHKKNPIVGLDYLVELRDLTGDHMYFCTLCEKIGDPRVTITHLLSQKHSQKFMGQHFPKTKEALIKNFVNDKQTLTKAFKYIYGKIEGKLGRQSPVVVNRMVFETNKDIIIKKIIGNKHFREPLDDTFVDLVENKTNYLRSLLLKDSEDPDITGIKAEVDDLGEDDNAESSNSKEVHRKSEFNIEAMLKCIDRPVIGVEYLIELTASDKEPVFMCAYCDKKFDPKVVMCHFTSYKHCAKYINVFFPTAKKSMLYLLGTMKECKKGIAEMIMILCARIQEKYGWLRPRCYDEDYFERNRKTIIDEITHGEHLKETPEENFVEFVEKTVRVVTSYKDYDAPSLDVPPMLPSPPSEVIKREPWTYDNQFHSMPQMPVRPLHLPPSTEYMPQLPKENPVYLETMLPSGRSRTILQVPLQKPVQTKNEQHSKRSGTQAKLPKKSRSRSRSGSSSGFEFGRSSPVDEGLKNTLKWEIYTSKLKELHKELTRDMNYYRMNPKKHPLYGAEWKKFWNDRYDTMEAKGKDPTKQNIMPEWISFWNKRVQELFKQKFENMKQDLKLTHGLNVLLKPETKEYNEKMDTYEDIGYKRRRERRNSESPPLKQSRDRDQDEKSRERSRERKISIEKTRRSKEKTRERTQDRKSMEKESSRDRTREKRIIWEEAKERCSRGESQDKKLQAYKHEPGRKPGGGPCEIGRRFKEERYVSPSSQSTNSSLEKSRQKYKDKRSNEENQSIKSNVINTGLVSVLRIAAALEDHLGSLGPKVNALLGTALALEKMAMHASDAILSNSEHFSLLETVKEKLRGQIMTKIVDRNLVMATKKCIGLLETVLAKAEKNIALRTIDIDTSPIPTRAENSNTIASVLIDPLLMGEDFSIASGAVPQDVNLGKVTVSQQAKNLSPVALLSNEGYSRALIGESVTVPANVTVERVAIAQNIASFLIKQGKYDISEQELAQLINNVAMKQSSSGSLTSFPSKLQQQELQQQKNLPGNSPPVLQLQQQQHQNQIQPETSSSNSLNTIEHLSDNDLHNLLKYFKILPTEEQQALIKYLKMLEVTQPEKVNKLRETLNINSALSALTKTENFERSTTLVEQRKQIETSNICSQFGNADNNSHEEYSFVKQFRDREKPSAELDKMKGLTEDLGERKNDILRQITSSLNDMPSKPKRRGRATLTITEYHLNSPAAGSSYGSQLQPYLWSQQQNQE